MNLAEIRLYLWLVRYLLLRCFQRDACTLREQAFKLLGLWFQVKVLFVVVVEGTAAAAGPGSTHEPAVVSATAPIP